MSSRSELSRRITVRSLGIKGSSAGRTHAGGAQASGADDVALEMVVEADASERVAVARRLNEPAIETFTCRFRLSEADKKGRVTADGLLAARLTRTCVVTLEEFPVVVAEQFMVRFVPAEPGDEQADVELDLDADDDVPYDGTTIDLGEAAIEQLALALDPYPRKPGAERPPGVVRGDPPTGEGTDRWSDDPDAEVTAEDGNEEAARPHPFAALARLRREPD
ncbi:MAG: DUF177 domain-containing protein [Janthinobacterium lividum]